MTPLKLLVSARDPAAALHMAAVCRKAQGDRRFEISIVAQPPALKMLRSLGFAVLEVPPIQACRLDDGASQELLRLADKILAAVQPDVILCGLSSPSEGGIDEALLASRNVPAFLMQDFWGEQNLFFGAGADVLFVLDRAATSISQERWGASTIVTGSPRHAHYSDFDSLASRRRMRDRLGIPLDRPVIGVFGQPLQRFEGYKRTLNVLAKVINALHFPVVVMYRPHPREGAQEQELTCQWFNSMGIDVKMLVSSTTEEALSTCDAACTIFSNCAYDSAYLNYYSPQPLLTPIMLLFDSELVSFYSNIAKFSSLPYFSQGLVLPVWHEQETSRVLVDALSGAAKERIWRNCKTVLSDPIGAVENVLEAIADFRGSIESDSF